ncbi:transposase [Clostridium botulinum C]|uniref:IS transposase n=4 Tax=Clostridium botulinum TaxID=1491 RepID=A0A9P2LKC0_CLOBO|nr:hypothetical protein [Clostridium botulinum]EES90292.1 putative IS transposase [Clostridium phage D-1873]MCD3200302.1 transposase [Clostridium botulinum C]MCD3207534.1 transposase [Clostridium botulinum C]MCD3226268.1 transposase [Clostridium botulinum C]MCD3245276.1 transposase [Clostridium botulinum C]
MAKSKTPSYVLTLRLGATKSDISALNTYFELSRKLYNALLGEGLKRFRLMRESKMYQQARKETKKINKNKLFKEVQLKYKFSNFDLNKYSTSLRVNEFKNIDANTVQALSARAIKSIDRMRFGEAKRVNFIKYNEMYSMEGLNNRQGIRYRDGFIYFNKLKLPVIIRKNDTYAQKCIQDRVKFCRIIKKYKGNSIRYYVQLILEGIPPIKHTLGTGEVGLDIGTRTIAVSSENDVKLLELAPEIDNIENQKRILNRKLDRQRRANNPNKYNEDGTIKKGNRDRWINSNNYLKTKAKLRDIQSRLASIRKQDHEKMANYILSLGSIIKVETMNYKGLQARAKETTINEKTGRFNKKKRFGKSLANKAPSMLLDIINRKLKYHNLGLFKIDTYKIKASQYNPFTNEYIKKSLSERWNRFKINEQEIQIQRDLMSALIIKNVIIDKKLKLDKVNKEKLLDEFDSFKKLHDIEILRLKNCKNRLLNSMGI